MAGDPATFPFNSVVLIESPNPDGDGYLLGSGVVIGPHTILTASHVVYDITEQTALKDIHLYPGWESADPALGPGDIPTTDTDHFNEIGALGSDTLIKAESALDFAVIDTSYTFSGWMGVLLNYPGGTVNVTGYPASAGGFQSNRVGTVSEDPRSPVLDYGTLSVSPGNSGGPLWLDSIGSDDVVGLVSTSGWASLLTTADWDQIDSWVSEDGYSLGANVSPVVTAVSSPSLVEGQSIAASSLIASISNPSGDDITEDIYEDLGGGSGFFTVNGVRQPDGVWISPSPSEDVRYVAGSSPGSDTLGVGVHDATTNSNFSTSLDVTAEAEVAEGKAFTLLFQNSNGQAAIWDLSGAIVTGSALLGANPGPSWRTIGTGDFNDDSEPDILLQNTNGNVAVWETDGTNVTTAAAVANPGSNWKAIGTGDFNDDPFSDILLQNTNGAVAIWDMGGTNGTSVTSSAVVTNPGPNWKAVATGDFDGDHHSDIVLQNTNGSVAIWEMGGTSGMSSAVVTNPGANWKVIGTGDFNGDGNSDILLQNTSGAVAIWEMGGPNGTSVMSSAVVANPGPSWHAIGTGGEGSSDILLQSTSGQTAIWDMSGTSIASAGAVSPNPGSSWRAVGLS